MPSKKLSPPVNVGVPVPPPIDRAKLLAEWRGAYDTWTAPIGTAVEVTRDDSTTYRTKTCSLPWLVGSGTPVISVEGDASPRQSTTVMLTRVRVFAIAPEGAPAADSAPAGAA